MVFRCKIQIFRFQKSVAKFKYPDLFPNVMLAVCVLLEKLSVLSGHHGSGPGFVYQVFYFAYFMKMQTCTFSSKQKKKIFLLLARICITSFLLSIFEENANLLILLKNFFCQDLRVHRMVYATLATHILRKNMLSNTYDGLLTMKLDS